MAHDLGMQVVAEGVERLQQHHFLQAKACDHIQGWLVARPMEAGMFESWWQRRQATHAPKSAKPLVLHGEDQ
jgi:EAL domain-containing protein (putative c-di-GMP-specific phosphodiesterase class I)